LTLKVVILENAHTMFLFFLAVLRMSFMRCTGVSKVPEVKEPSKRIIPWLAVFASIVCSHRSRRLAKRVGICRRFGVVWWLFGYWVLKYAFSSVL